MSAGGDNAGGSGDRGEGGAAAGMPAAGGFLAGNGQVGVLTHVAALARARAVCSLQHSFPRRTLNAKCKHGNIKGDSGGTSRST